MTQNIFVAIEGLHEDKSCDTSQGMVPTNVNMVHKPPYSISRATSIDSDPSAIKQTNHAPSVLINKPKFLKATRYTEIREFVLPRFIAVEALSR